MKLDDLDQRFLPRAAAVVGRWAERIRRGRDKGALVTDGVKGLSPQALDDRFARSGPLGMVRDVPQVGAVVIALVFFAGAGTLLSQESANSRAQRDKQASEQVVSGGGGEQVTGRDSLGPEVGDTTVAYEAAATRTLREASKKGGKDARVALVSLTGYQTPAQAKALFQGVTVSRVYLRAKAAGREAAQLPIDIKGDLLGDLKKAYDATARGRVAAQKSYQGYVDTLTVTTKEEQAFKDLYASFAKATGVEAKAYRSSCACVFAVVVKASPAKLLALRSVRGVRMIEVAAPTQALADVQVYPLLPEIKGVVPKIQAGGEGVG